MVSVCLLGLFLSCSSSSHAEARAAIWSYSGPVGENITAKQSWQRGGNGLRRCNGVVMYQEGVMV